jgi:hypothetical protein
MEMLFTLATAMICERPTTKVVLYLEVEVILAMIWSIM